MIMNKIIEEKCKYCEHFNNKLNLLDKCTKNGYLVDFDGSIKVECPLENKIVEHKGSDNIIK